MNRPAMRLGLACACLLWAAGGVRADDPEKAQATFNALFAQDLARVRETGETTDDAALSARLLETARKATDQPAFLARVCEAACDLGLAHPSGYAAAAEAMELLALHVPEKADGCRARLLDVRQKQFDAAAGDAKKAAGEVLLDVLVAEAEAKQKAGALVEAAAAYRRAQGVARAAGSPRLADLDERLEALAQRMKAVTRVADVKAMLVRDPKNVSAREGLVRLYLVDLDDPAAAAECLEGCKDADLLKYVPAAAKPVEAAPELACLELGEWYRAVADAAPKHGKAAMYARARAYLERFLAIHPVKDLDQTRATVALEKVTEAVAKLTAGPPKPAPREKPAKPEPGTVGPGRWIDLAPLVDLARDVAEGKAEREGTVLKTFSTSNMRMTVPLVAQGDYEAEFAFRRTWGPGQVSFTLPVGPTEVTLIVGGVAGAFSGLEKINGRGAEHNETVIRPSKFDNDRLYVVAVRVQMAGGQARIETTLDGSPFVRWAGSAEALAASYQVAARGCFGLGCWGAGYTFDRARVRMLSGTARLLRAPGTPAAPSPAAAAIRPGPWVDLLPLVDPGRDAVLGNWSAGEQGLTMTGPGGTRLAIPVSVQGDYQLRVEFAQMQGDNEVAFILPVGTRATALLIGKEVRRRSGLFWAEKGDAMVSPAPLTNREPHVLEVTVRTQTGKADIDVRLDGEPYFRWQGGASSLTVWDAYQMPHAECVGLGAWGGEVAFRSVKLKMLSGTARPLRAPGTLAAPPASEPATVPAGSTIRPGQWVDLVPLISLDRDRVSGEWAKAGSALVKTTPEVHGRIMLPVVPDGSYELAFSFVREGGGGSVDAILPVGDQGVLLSLGGWMNTIHCLHLIDGRVGDSNPTCVRGMPLEEGRLYNTVVRVERSGDRVSVRAYLDGRVLTQWSGPASALSLRPEWTVPDPTRLGLMANNLKVTLPAIRLRMLSGEARLVR